MLAISKIACLISLSLLAIPGGAFAQDKETKSTTDQQSSIPTYVPAETTVAILPVVSATGGAEQAQNERETTQAFRELVKEFTKHGFKLIPDKEIASVIQETKTDMTDEEQQKRGTLYKIARLLKADIIVFAMVTDTKQVEVEKFFSNTKEGQAKVKFWMLDVKKEVAIKSAKETLGKSHGRYYAERTGRALIARACGDAVENAFKLFFKPYPIANAKSISESTKD